MNFWKHIKAIFFLPFMVLVIVPLLIISNFGFNTLGIKDPYLDHIIFPLIGASVALLGLTAMFITIKDMNKIGKGTLAPWDKKQHLVVVGLYRYVRNPMLTGVLLILTGEAMLFSSKQMVYWLLIFSTINFVYISLVEEKELEKQFDDQYRLYKKNVPSWLPRITPWDNPESNSSTKEE